jgi:hypothetical protein
MRANDPDRSLQDWFEAVEPRTVPTQILEKVFAVTRRSGQRRGWAGRLGGALGFDQSLTGRGRMNRLLLSLGGVATAAVVAVVGLAYFYGPGGPGGPTGPLHVSERHGYSVRLPDDSWLVEERPGTWLLGQFFEANTPAGVDYFEDLDENGEPTLYVYLSSQPIPDGMSFQDWIGLNDAATAREQPCFQLMGEHDLRTLDGETARTGTYSCDNFEATGIPYTGVQTLVAHDGRGFAIYVWPAPKPGFGTPRELSQSDLEAEAARWLARFSFNDGTTGDER